MFPKKSEFGEPFFSKHGPKLSPPPHPRRQQKSLAKEQTNSKNECLMIFHDLYEKKYPAREPTKGSQRKKYRRFPEGLQTRKSNNGDKHDQGHEKRRPSTLC